MGYWMEYSDRMNILLQISIANEFPLKERLSLTMLTNERRHHKPA